MGKNTTAENYRQFINSPAIQTAKYFFNVLLSEEYTSLNKYISEIKTGKTPSKSNSKYYSFNDINWFKPSDIGNDIYLSEATSKLSSIAKIEKKITDFKKNTLLITCIGDIGRIGILKEDGTSNQQITGVLLNDKVIPEYVYLYFVSNRELFTENGVLKTTLPIINQKIIKNLQIKVPPIDLQQKVVDFFLYFIQNDKPSDKLFVESYTENILNFSQKVNLSKTIGTKLYTEIQNKKILLKKLRQSILQEAIEGKLTASWREQNPDVESASILLEKIKAEKEQLIRDKKIKKQKPLPPINKDEIPFDIPDSWVWCRLGDVVTDIKGGGTPSKHNPSYWNGTIPWASVKDLKGEQLFKTKDYITQDGLDNSSSNLIVKNNLIISTRMGLGKILFNNINVAINQDLKALYVKSIYKKHFFYTYKTYAITGRGTTVDGIRQEVLLKYLYPLPPLKEQKEIVKKIESLFKVCDELEIQINSSKTNSQTLMQAVLKEAFETREGDFSEKAPSVQVNDIFQTIENSLKQYRAIETKIYHKRKQSKYSANNQMMMKMIMVNDLTSDTVTAKLINIRNTIEAAKSIKHNILSFFGVGDTICGSYQNLIQINDNGLNLGAVSLVLLSYSLYKSREIELEDITVIATFLALKDTFIEKSQKEYLNRELLLDRVNNILSSYNKDTITYRTLDIIIKTLKNKYKCLEEYQGRYYLLDEVKVSE